MLQRFLLIWLSALSALAYFWPDWNAEWDPFRLSKPYLSTLITVTMFAIGCLLPRDELREVARRWPTVLGGTLVQYSVMPLAAFAFGRWAGLEGDLMLGVILVGCVPGAMASNVLTLAARGNVSYSVSLTTSATLLSPLVVPAVLYAYLQESSANPGDIAANAFRNLLLQVVLPVVAGHLLARWWPLLDRLSRRWAPVVANLAILWIIAVVVNSNHKNLTNLGGVLFAVLFAVNIIGYIAGWFGGRAMRLPGSQTRALALEVGMQNAGLGSALASQLFQSRDLVMLPAGLYTFGCMLTGTILAQYWSRTMPRD